MKGQVTVLSAPIGVDLTLVRADGEPALAQRLAALGLRRGARFSVVQVTSGGGRTVRVAGARIALDRWLAGRLHAEVLL